MRKLGKDLKRALAALAYEDAGDYLSMHDKLEIIGYGDDEAKKHPHFTPRLVSNRVTNKRIAFISDGRGSGSPLSYVIDASRRQHAEIDLLVHGTNSATSISIMEKRIREAGVNFRRISVADNPIKEIINYIRKQSSLIFLVGMPDDSTSKILLEEMITRKGRRLSIPLVLIDETKYSESCREEPAA